MQRLKRAVAAGTVTAMLAVGVVLPTAAWAGDCYPKPPPPPSKVKKQRCNAGNGNGSDAISFTAGAHCFGGDPGNSFRHNRGGDEIPTTVPQGGQPNPGGNNVP